MNPLALVVEAVASIVREARRIAPMAAGIVWGVASVFVLVAISNGFEATQRKALDELGDSFLLLRINRPTSTRGDVRTSSFVQLDGGDMVAARQGAPSIELLSPKAFNWFMRVSREGERARASVIGVTPEYAEVVNIPLEPGGRWIDPNDIEQELLVAVLGPGARTDLFGDEPYLGRQIQVSHRWDDDSQVRRLTVIGALKDQETTGDSVYLSHRNAVFTPFPVFERMSDGEFMFFVVKPRTHDLRDQALAELRATLGRRHGFDVDDTGALLPYFDAIERGRQIDAIFGGLETFLTAVGALIMLLGAVGVANVVLMSVAARRFEFGLRRALGCKRRWIFGQVFLEAATVCVVSGGLGFLLGTWATGVMSGLDLPEGFAAPRAELDAALLPGLLLLAVSVVAAAWPAWRAARLPVARALHGSGL